MDINFGLKPFWFWNGEMEDKEISRQIREMSNMSIGGFFIHARQGLETPYLSQMWFDKVALAVDEARRSSMEVWLYDEYPYPSGISGGEVILQHPEYEARNLFHKKIDVTGPDVIDMELPWGEAIMARAYPVESGHIKWNKDLDIKTHIGICHREQMFQTSNLTDYSQKRFATGGLAKKINWSVPSGRWVVYIFMEVPVNYVKYFGKFIDPINPDAVAHFINTTHEKYKRHFGSEFGKTIKGIYTDETGPVGREMPWSRLLPQYFMSSKGYSLVDSLPALLDDVGERTSKIRYDYWDVIVDAFIKSYDMQIHNWCTENNLLYVGEKAILRAKQLRHMDVAGIDAGHVKAGGKPEIASCEYRSNAKYVSSAASFYSKDRSLCECFHSVGWGMTLRDMKWNLDLLTVQGIDFFVPHAFFYTTDNLRKHDAPPSGFFQQPFWKYSDELAIYANKLSGHLAGLKRQVEVLVLDPVTSTWTAMGERAGLKKRIKEDCSSIQKKLLENHYDYYIVDTDVFSDSRIEDGRININGQKFQVLVIPPMLNIEKGTFNKVKEYAEQNGIIIFNECLPIEVIDDDDNRAHFFEELLGVNAKKIYESYVHNSPDLEYTATVKRNNIELIKDSDLFIKTLNAAIDRPLSITDGEKEVTGIITARYNKCKDWYCFMVNTTGNKQNVKVKIRLKQFNCSLLQTVPLERTDKEKILDFNEYNGHLHFAMSLEPYQSTMIEMKNDSSLQNFKTNEQVARKGLEIDSVWEIEAVNMNALRIGLWDFRVIDGDSTYSREELSKSKIECKPVIDQLNDSGIALPIKVREFFGCPKELVLPELDLMYSSEFYIDKMMPIWLVMEPESIRGEWEIFINDKKVVLEDFKRENFYLPSNLAFNATRYLKKGINKIEVKVHALQTWHGLVNPLYLFGSFGVFRHSNLWHIGPTLQRGKIKDVAAYGYPFYAGDMVYTSSIDIQKHEAGGFIEIYIDNKHFEYCTELSVNGVAAGVRCWNPYVWRLEDSVFHAGENTVKLKITTSLLGLFEGKVFNPELHRNEDV